MEDKSVITKVTKPTNWVNSLVIREKDNGRLRLCLDPKDLNEAIQRDHYPVPTLEEITQSFPVQRCSVSWMPEMVTRMSS